MVEDWIFSSAGKKYRLHLPTLLSQGHDSTEPFWTGGIFHIADATQVVSQWSFAIAVEEAVRQLWAIRDSDLLSTIREIGSLLFLSYSKMDIEISNLGWAQFKRSDLRILMRNEVPSKADVFVDVLRMGQWEDRWLTKQTVKRSDSDSGTKRLTKISIAGFRRIRDLNMDVRPVTVMIGSNGVGKTSILDAFSLLAAAASGTLNEAINDLGGISELLTSGYRGDLRLGAQIESNEQDLNYEIEIQPRGASYAISKEVLFQTLQTRAQPFRHILAQYGKVSYFNPSTGEQETPTWREDQFESTLSQVPKTIRIPEEAKNTLSSVIQYHSLDVDKRAPVKLPQKMKPAKHPGLNGEQLVPFLYNLRESASDQFEVIEDTLRAAFPTFESIAFPSAAPSLLSMTWKDQHFDDPLYMHQLSEGTLRFIWLVSLLRSQNPSTLTLIDEPEVSLHPEMLSLFADLIREASKKTQVIVATHSDRLIRFLEPNEVLVLDINDEGHTIANWADSLDIEKWLDEYTLDKVWSSGQMGGRP